MFQKLKRVLLGRKQNASSHSGRSTEGRLTTHAAGANPFTSPDLERKTVVSITPAAAVKLREYHASEPKPYLRVAITEGGPTGFLYSLAFDDEVDAFADYLDVAHGFSVVVERRIAQYLYGTKIDWQITADGREGFHFANPNARRD